MAERLGISYYDIHSISVRRSPSQFNVLEWKRIISYIPLFLIVNDDNKQEHHHLNHASLVRMWRMRQEDLMESIRRRRDLVPRVRRVELDVKQKVGNVEPVVSPSSQGSEAITTSTTSRGGRRQKTSSSSQTSKQTAVVNVFNFVPHGNFGPILARSAASLYEFCTKHGHNEVFKSKVLLQL